MTTLIILNSQLLQFIKKENKTSEANIYIYHLKFCFLSESWTIELKFKLKSNISMVVPIF